ncbi:MAG TPA: hypothetical protein PLW14_11385 [Chlorobiota bacterium]|nr:hypothetical protein [Chlorobiota bacterium]
MKHLLTIVLTLALAACSTIGTPDEYEYTVYFTKGFRQDTVAVTIDNVAVGPPISLTTWSVLDKAGSWIEVRVDSGLLVAEFKPHHRIAALGEPRKTTQFQVTHKNVSFTYSMDVRQGKWLLVSLDSVIRFEQWTRAPIFD